MERREARLLRLYALGPGDYEAMLVIQGGRCAICREEPKPGRHLAVDHRHGDGLTRGLLCWLCNKALQAFRDDVARLRAAAAYLEEPPATHALGGARYGRTGRVTTRTKRRRK
jgi:hypothetical protein